MRSAIFLLGLAGAVAFAGAWLLSYTHPLLVERAARGIMRVEVAHSLGERLDGVSEARVAHAAPAELQAIQERIRAQTADRVATVVADMLDPDCECRRRLTAYGRDVEGRRLEALKWLAPASGRLEWFIETSYASARQGLMREFRIFTASNALAFALLALVAFMRKQAKLQLLLPAIVIFAAVALTGGLYLFKQDWLHTIVFGHYLGWGYAAYLSGVALLLADIVLNRARVTTHLVNGIGAIVGVAVTAVPC